jgi:hypothetical protein
MQSHVYVLRILLLLFLFLPGKHYVGCEMLCHLAIQDLKFSRFLSIHCYGLGVVGRNIRKQDGIQEDCSEDP